MGQLQKIGKQIISEEMKNNYHQRMNNDIRMTALFSPPNQEMGEEDNDVNPEEITKDVIHKIDHDVTPEEFEQSMYKSRRVEMLAHYSARDFRQMKLFKVEGHDIGFALKMKNGRYGEIVSVYNNDPHVRGIGNYLIFAAIRNGGCWLDHFDGYLSNLYSSLGFVEYKRHVFKTNKDISKENTGSQILYIELIKHVYQNEKHYISHTTFKNFYSRLF